MSEQPKIKVLTDGSKMWWLNGNLHRIDGPAVERADGTKEWWLNGQFHRSDGPAVEWANGSTEWRLNGKAISWQELFHQANDPETELRILIAALTTT